MITGQVGARILFEVRMGGGFPGEWDVDPFVLLFLFGLYAVALFGFHVFDPVPAARSTPRDHGRILAHRPTRGQRKTGSRERILTCGNALGYSQTLLGGDNASYL